MDHSAVWTCPEVMARWQKLREQSLPQNSTCRAAVVTLVSLGSTRELSGVQRTQLGQARWHREGCATCQAYMSKQVELAVVEQQIEGCPGCKMARHQLVLQGKIEVNCNNALRLWLSSGKPPRTAEQERKSQAVEKHFVGCPACALKRAQTLRRGEEKAKEPTGSHALPDYSRRRIGVEPRATRSSV